MPGKVDQAKIPHDWLVIGDSVSKGIILNEDKGRYEASPKNFVSRVAEAFGATVKNVSMFGATVLKGLQIWDRQEKRLPAKGICIMEFGGNDCDYLWSEIAEAPEAPHDPNVPHSRFFQLYHELIDKVKAKGWIPVILSLPPLEPKRYFDTFSKNLNKSKIMEWLGGSTQRIYQWHESYNDMLPQLAEETGSYFLDIRQAFLKHRNPEQFMCADGIHPNEKGHQLIASALMEMLGISADNGLSQQAAAI